MGRSKRKVETLEEQRITDKCIENNEGPQTDISPECLEAAMEAMFMDRYNVTITYNDEVRIQWRPTATPLPLK
jgi:hypothetical protein